MEQVIELKNVCSDVENPDHSKENGLKGKEIKSSADSILKDHRPLSATSNSDENKNKRVYFPQDGNVVTGYSDAPNPWHGVKTFTTQELVVAYKAACDDIGVKPLPKLLNQLNAIQDFGERLETLTLKGDRLDIKHCETLEEILKRVQFKTIDLEATHLDDEGAGAIFDMIEYYESANKLNISFNRNIGTRGWQACSKMLKKTPCLESLDARNCIFTEQSMPFIGRSLRMGSHLSILHLENSNLSGRSLYILVASLKMNELLKELFLADNKLMPSDGIQLGNLLKFNHRLQLLDLRNNHLQDVGTSHIADGLYEQNLGVGLLTLVLWNNQISYQSMASVARSLTSNQSLETLNLGHNSITNEGVLGLKEGLLKNKSLLRFGLQAAKLSCEGAIALAEYIADTKKLLRIDLRENDIKTAGLMALSLSLKVNESVNRIDLDKEPKRESGVKDYAEQQKKMMSDINNWLQRNRDLARDRAEAERLVKAQEELKEASAEEQVVETVVENVEIDDTVPIPEIEESPPTPPPTDKHHLSLFINGDETRQQTLESPMFIREDELSVVTIPHQTDTTSLSPVELSPRTRAKKMFTVNRVAEPHRQTDVAPAEEKLLEVTANTYVSTIMKEAVGDMKLDIHAAEAALEKFPKDIIVSPDESPVVETAPTRFTLVLDNSSVGDCAESLPSVNEGNSTSDNFTHVITNTDNTEPVTDSSVQSLCDISDSHKDLTSPISSESRSEMPNNDDVECDDALSSNISSSESATTDDGNIVVLIADDDNSNADLVQCVNELSLESSDAKQVSQTANIVDTPVDISSADTSSECINKHSDTSEISSVHKPLPTQYTTNDNDNIISVGEVKDPDFHSNLSINGVAMELSKVLDSLEKDPKPENDPGAYKTVEEILHETGPN
ncbi:uncharacterized protein LOC141914863 isoform X2 [Tubulanus polymorphus]|uniref:uncharacterized protein LOC141914863 isoform X2 n=1 Tax=Tubulanus polymorphus TaxID=672921 RepID=UPI003DA3146C